ncbi:MAG: Uma2 family endonuclease [Bacteroidota bacterium]
MLTINLPTDSAILDFPNGISAEGFEKICLANPDIIVEREPDGKVTLMSPVSFNSADNEAEFIADLKIYARKHGGKATSSAVGLTLPDSSVRLPDACYVSEETLKNFTEEDLDHLVELVPDFVVEVLSPTDSLDKLKDKMQHVWIANGVKLAWLVDVKSENLWIYRLDGSVELIDDFQRKVSGEDVLPGFEFDLRYLG